MGEDGFQCKKTLDFPEKSSPPIDYSGEKNYNGLCIQSLCSHRSETPMYDSPFEQSALASGFITQDLLKSAWRELKGTGMPKNSEEIPARLAEIFVNRGTINRWQAQQLLAGRKRFTLGQYRIYDCIGHGGMGQVFKARKSRNSSVVAIKVLPLTKSTPQAIANFQKEIQLQSKLSHPNLVRALDTGKDGNVYYLVTEYVAGPDLRRLIRSRGPLTQESAASIIVQIAKGLQYAHDAGLVHRDIKPGNILVMMNGIAKLSDLGLASPMEDEDETDGKSSEKNSKVVGTIDYLCPDQLRNPRKPLPIWDIYSLGCTLYYIVTGKVPYPGGTTKEKMRAHLDEETFPLDPCRLNPLLSRDFVEVIADMMAKTPEERIPTASEVIARMEPWSDGTPREIELIENENSAAQNTPMVDFLSFIKAGKANMSQSDAAYEPLVFPTNVGSPFTAMPPAEDGAANEQEPLVMPFSVSGPTQGAAPTLQLEAKVPEDTRGRWSQSEVTFDKVRKPRKKDWLASLLNLVPDFEGDATQYIMWILMGAGIGAGVFFLWIMLAKLF